MSNTQDCNATVTFLQAVMAGEPIWEVTFKVEIQDTQNSSGLFTFDITTLDENGNSHTVRAEESWQAMYENIIEAKYEISLSPGTQITGVSVDTSSIRCTKVAE